METSFIELPARINVDPMKYYKTTRDVCYWTNERRCSDEIIYHFVEKAKEYNFTEDQALALLMYNNFDLIKSEYDMHIYRPIKGLAKVDLKQLVKIISEGIAKTVKSREHRDFDDVHLMFPGYTVGDVLGAYSKHRFLIKKETYKMKKCIKKSTLKPFVTNGGLKEFESLSWNESCSDTQFHLIFQKHYSVIQNSSQFQDFLSRELSDIKHYNGNSIRLSETYNDNEADGILTLLRKMNRKKSKPGSMFERYQLSNMLTSAALEKRNRSLDIITLINDDDDKSGKGTKTLSSVVDSKFSNTRDISSDTSLEDKLLDFIKSDNSILLLEDDSSFDDRQMMRTLKVLSEQHEAVLESFKKYLPDPDNFQQLCHSWSNMDFAILLLGLTEFGKNFQKISDSIFTKTEAMVASFYVNHSSDFNLDDIVTQPFREIDTDPVHNDSGLDEFIPSAKIKVEDMDQDTSSVDPTTSNGSTTNRSKNSSASKKKKKPASKSPPKPRKSRSEQNDHTNDKSNANKKEPTLMNLRSRLETKMVMKSLIDEEIKLKNMKFRSKKNLKRKSNNKGTNDAEPSKRIKKTKDAS